MNQEKTGKFIAELRKEKAWSQAELGERIGVTNKTVSRWENGNYMPDISLMEVLCAQFDININELISGGRLNDEDFRRQADYNMVQSLMAQKGLRRRKHLTDFLEGGGTGILLSTLFAPGGLRRTVTIIVAVMMILVGWYFRKKLFESVAGADVFEVSE